MNKAVSFIRFLSPLLWVPLLFSASGCGTRQDDSDSSNILVEVGDSVMTQLDVERMIPGGLSEADSVAMFDAIVSSWVQRLLLEDLGRENVDDMDRIDRLTAEYRARLIVDAYRRDLRENEASMPSKGEIRAYYDAHKDSLLLERPIVKGVFVKVPADASDLDAIRRWAFSGEARDIDALEKHGLQQVVQYSYFEDRWVDWQKLAELIPSRFPDPDAFVKENVNFETSYKGVVYLLHISEHMPSGAVMPPDYAAPVIAGILDRRSASEFERKLLVDIGNKAIKEGRLKLVNVKRLRF